MRQEHDIKTRLSWLRARYETQNAQKNAEEGLWYRIQELEWMIGDDE